MKVRLNRGGGVSSSSASSLSRFETKPIMLGGASPTFDQSKHDSVGRVVVTPGDAFLIVQAVDWKPVRHRLLGEGVIPLQKLKVNKSDGGGRRRRRRGRYSR